MHKFTQQAHRNNFKISTKHVNITEYLAHLIGLMGDSKRRWETYTCDHHMQVKDTRTNKINPAGDKTRYSRTTRPIPLLLMTWLFTSPSRPHSWQWLCTMGKLLSLLGVNSSNQQILFFEEWCGIEIITKISAYDTWKLTCILWIWQKLP